MARGKGEGSVYKRGDGLWAASIELPAHIDDNGKTIRRRKVISSKSKAKVIKGLAEMRRALETSGDLPTASMTVTQWSEYWFREIAVKTRRPKTLEAYQSAVKQRVLPTLGHIRLDKVTPAQLRKVTAATEAEKSSTYARNVHAVMSAMFKDAEREGRIPRNPAELVQAPRKAVTTLHALTVDEAIALLDVFKNTDEGVLWATFILTGARRGEVLGLEWDRVTDEIDLSWQLQRITGGQTLPAGFEYRHLSDGLYLTRPKTRSGWRVIPLVDPLKGILDRWRESGRPNDYGLLFTRENGQPIDPDHATKTWPKILEAAGIDKHVRVHDLRHTTVDLLYAAGLDEDDIKAIVGHSSRAMSRSYKSKANQDRLRASMVQFAKSLER